MRKPFKKNLFIRKFFLYLILIILLISVCYPLFWSIMTSFKTRTEVLQFPTGLPKEPTLQAYKYAWTIGEFGKYFRNSLIITISSVIGIILLCSLAGYGFARYKFKSSRLIFIIFMSSMVVSAPSIMIAQYKLIQTIHLLNTYVGIIFIYFSWTTLGIMLTRIAFQEIPQELIDAAYLDGCNEFRIYWMICLPIIKPSIATVIVFYFIWIWNDFIWPLIILQNPEYLTMTVGLLGFQGKYLSNWPIITAGISISVVPVLILYLIFQKFFVRGLTLGALK